MLKNVNLQRKFLYFLPCISNVLIFIILCCDIFLNIPFNANVTTTFQQSSHQLSILQVWCKIGLYSKDDQHNNKYYRWALPSLILRFQRRLYNWLNFLFLFHLFGRHVCQISYQAMKFILIILQTIPLDLCKGPS